MPRYLLIRIPYASWHPQLNAWARFLCHGTASTVCVGECETRFLRSNWHVLSDLGRRTVGHLPGPRRAWSSRYHTLAVSFEAFLPENCDLPIPPQDGRPRTGDKQIAWASLE